MEVSEYDLNGNGKIDKQEREIMLEDRRLEMMDRDAKRDTERGLTIACAAGMLLYPFLILIAAWLGLDHASSLLADIAPVYSVAASGVVVGYFGFNAMGARK